MIPFIKGLAATLLVMAAIGLAGHRGPESRLSTALTHALSDQKSAVRAADGRLKVWVRFSDKGVAPAQLPEALAAAGHQLSARTLARRARVFDGAPLVDGRDLPVARSYVGRCEATGAQFCRESRWLNAASFLADDTQIRSLAALPEVAHIDLVARFMRAAIPTPIAGESPVTEWPAAKSVGAIDYGANTAAMVQINVPPAHDILGLTGAGVVVAMLDTGFRTLHESLVHIPVLDAWDFVNNDAIVENEPTDPPSSRNHGTMTLSTVAAQMPGKLVAPAPRVSVLLAKTEDVSQEVPIEEDNWVAGLEWAEARGADIISSSLGYIDWYLFSDLDGNTAVTTVAADLAVGRGLVVVNSAGNQRASTGSLLAPADGDSVIAVGAVDTLGVVTWFSSPGPTADGRFKPDVAALGLSNRVANPGDDTGYVSASGTSFACPLVAAVAALVLERVPDLTPIEVREALRQTASHPLNPNNDTGWGIVNAYAAATWFGPVFAHAPLVDPQTVAGPWVVDGTITARLGVAAATPVLVHRVAGGPWLTVAMTPAGAPDTWSALLPAAIAGVRIDYYLAASDQGAHATAWPQGAPTAFFSFTVAPGTSPVGDMPHRPYVWLGPAVPNPFNPRTDLKFALPASGPVRLTIFDARGRLVRTLLDGGLDAGDHAVTWDGRDDRGRPAPSGTYLYRLSSGGATAERKMQLVR